jgi:hypothetical protein
MDVHELIVFKQTGESVIGLRDYIALASTAFAAIAASVACFSVRQSRLLQEGTIRPYLNGQMTQAAVGPLQLAVQNVGAGPARGVGFCVLIGDEYMRGYAAPNMGGIFKPGDREVLTSEFSGGAPGSIEGVLTCWDVGGGFHVFDLATGKQNSWRPARWWWRTPPSKNPEEALCVFYPDVNLGEMQKVSGRGKVK